MKTITTLVLLCALTGASAQMLALSQTEPAAETPDAPGVATDPQLLDPAYLSQVILHLYRWYIDEKDVDDLRGLQTFPFWVRPLEVKLDAGDNSRFAEIILPLVGLSTRVKKADYTVEELNTDIQSGTYRIISVSRIQVPDAPPPDAAVVDIDYRQMKDYLFRMRHQSRYPDQQMQNYLRSALLAHLGVDPAWRNSGEQIVHMAPLSPVANELWVFWENGKMLIRFASDIDLENPAMWEHQSLAVRTYDIEKQTVVSLNEAPGSNEFMTRDQVGRALFNCVILGKRLSTVHPPADGE